MTVYEIDPLKDVRWAELVSRHPEASVFHTTAWLEALHRTYGYQPMAFTTSAAGDSLANGVVCCQVRSWLTGRRVVSLPFSDHCEPLVNDAETLDAITARLDAMRRDGNWDYVELRPRAQRFSSPVRATASQRFWLHVLDLRPPEATLFNSFHKDSIQRKIHRADRERLVYDEGTSELLLREFYGLLQLTRRRHQLPPQPLTWFRNLIDAFGGSLQIRVARHEGRAIAAIMTLRHGRVMVYKYGASDEKCHPLGGMHFLFWRTIRDARASGCLSLDLGRCDRDNGGLATFKERWSATRSEIIYWRYAPQRASHGALRKYAIGGIRQVLRHAPVACRIAAGRFLYRHAG